MDMKSAKLFIDDGGESDVPIIFLHSLAGNTAQWLAQLSHVRQTHRAIAIDLRGHGQSANHAAGQFTIEGLVEDIYAVANELALKRFVLVGHSMGGAVAAAYAGRFPEQVAGLLLVDPAGDSTQIPEGQIQQFVDAIESEGYQDFVEGYWQQILTGATEATRATVMADLRSTPKATVVSLLKALFQFNPLPALRQYPGPKLIVAIPASESPISLHKLQPRLPHKMVTDTSHWLHMDKPALFDAILDEFLQSIEV